MRVLRYYPPEKSIPAVCVFCHAILYEVPDEPVNNQSVVFPLLVPALLMQMPVFQDNVFSSVKMMTIFDNRCSSYGVRINSTFNAILDYGQGLSLSSLIRYKSEARGSSLLYYAVATLLTWNA